MKKLSLYILMLAIIISCGQNENKNSKKVDDSNYIYSLPIPKGWSIEQFSIPISFARSISYSGVEEIRFSPGWGQSTSNDYWSYAFLWSIKGSPEITAAIIENNLNAYYTGLVNSNIQKNAIADKITPTRTSISKIETKENDKETYNGVVNMYDYLGRNPISLNCLIHLKACSDMNHTFILYEVSPKPFSDSIWQSLNQINSSLTCGRK